MAVAAVAAFAASAVARAVTLLAYNAFVVAKVASEVVLAVRAASIVAVSPPITAVP